jgi:hypothetical protein
MKPSLSSLPYQWDERRGLSSGSVRLRRVNSKRERDAARRGRASRAASRRARPAGRRQARGSGAGPVRRRYAGPAWRHDRWSRFWSAARGPSVPARSGLVRISATSCGGMSVTTVGCMPFWSTRHGTSTAAPRGSCGICPCVGDIAVDHRGRAGHDAVHDRRGVFVRGRVVDARGGSSASAPARPMRNLFFAALGVFIQRDAEARSDRGGGI